MEIILDNKGRALRKSFESPSVLLRSSLPGAAGASLVEKITASIEKTHSYYIRQQYEDGYWWYELESNVTMNSEYLIMLHFLDLQDSVRDKKIMNHILRNQRPDGTWAIHWGGEGDLSTTIEAYFALKLGGLSPDDERMGKAREFILAKGGVENSRVFTRIFLAIFGQFDWKGIPSIPVELNLMPAWFPINIYNFSSWARSTIVPLSLIWDFKPVKTLPESKGIRELYKNPGEIPSVVHKKVSLFSWKGFFIILDNLVKKIEHTPVRMLRTIGLERTERWILQHQGPEGDWGGIQPAMVNSVLALAAAGHDISSAPIKKGLEALERFTIEKGDELILQSCISPVWDTALTALALLYSGLDRNHPAILDACRWLASKQVFTKGDWCVKRPHLEPGGWAFEFENGWYPDVDDSAVVLMLLNRYSEKQFLNRENLEKGMRWVLGMQGKDGGWGAFDADNDMKILNQLPFGDLEAMIDPSTPDLTGRTLELLGLAGYDRSHGAVQKAIKFIQRTQEEDGPWWGRWGVNYIYGTSAVLNGLSAVGENMSAPYVKKAVEWSKRHQNSDGGWGECCESYGDRTLKCKGSSTPSQTAWVIMGLLAAGEENSDEVTRGIEYLLKRQKEDGTWEEECFTGTGFPKYFMLKYHNYRNCFPLMALGKYISRIEGRELFS